MLISHRNKFIYTKTVKTAGTSVESYFESYCMKKDEWSFCQGRDEYISEAGIIGCRTGNPLVIQASTYWNHMPAKTIKSLVGEDLWNSYFKFCVVRNPFSKAVSAYKHFASEQLKNADSLQTSFETWLTSKSLPIDRNKYLIDDDYCMDYVIRYESLVEDIETVCKKLNIPFQPDDLPKLNVGHTPETPLSTYYSNKSIEIVAHTYQDEMQRFAYSIPF